MVLRQKTVSYGFVELKQERDEYVLYVNGKVKSYSKDRETMEKEFDKIY